MANELKEMSNTIFLNNRTIFGTYSSLCTIWGRVKKILEKLMYTDGNYVNIL